MAREDERIEHPSFATIGISRVQIGGGGIRLFDSPFKHHHAIALEIGPACLIRSLHGDRVMPTGTVPHIRVHMSEVQFANLVLQANMHGGVACTVDSISGDRVPEPPKRDVKKLWADEVKRDFKEVADAAAKAERDAETLLGKDRVTKADVKALKDVLSKLAQDIRANLPWMQERFEEAMQKTVATARGEIEAHFASVIRNAGLEAVAKKGDLPLHLEMGGKEEGTR